MCQQSMLSQSIITRTCSPRTVGWTAGFSIAPWPAPLGQRADCAGPQNDGGRLEDCEVGVGRLDGLGVRLRLLLLGEGPVDAGRAGALPLALGGGDDQYRAGFDEPPFILTSGSSDHERRIAAGKRGHEMILWP